MQQNLKEELIAKLKKKKSILFFLTFLILTIIIWQTVNSTKISEPAIPKAKVVKGDITKSVSATGRVIPNLEVEIKCKASGKITNLPHEVSDYVKKGELLVELDPIDESRQVQASQASFSALQEQVKQSKINLSVAKLGLKTEIDKANANLKAQEAKALQMRAKEERLKKLYEEDFVTKQEYEEGHTAAGQAETDLTNVHIRFNELKTQELSLNAREQDPKIVGLQAEASRVELLKAQQRLFETKIYAPINGYVASKNVQIGQIVSSGISNVGGGTALLTIADLSHIFVVASVDESDIGFVRKGQKVKITVDAFPDEIFNGKVVLVSTKGINAADVVTFEVKIEVTSKNKSNLKPEMTANTQILISKKKNVLLVPSEAVSIQDGKHIVSILGKWNKVLKRSVKLGINDGIHTEILEGLQLGEEVVLNKGVINSEWQKDKNVSSKNRSQRLMMRSMGR